MQKPRKVWFRFFLSSSSKLPVCLLVVLSKLNLTLVQVSSLYFIPLTSPSPPPSVPGGKLSPVFGRRPRPCCVFLLFSREFQRVRYLFFFTSSLDLSLSQALGHPCSWWQLTRGVGVFSPPGSQNQIQGRFDPSFDLCPGPTTPSLPSHTLSWGMSFLHLAGSGQG